MALELSPRAACNRRSIPRSATRPSKLAQQTMMSLQKHTWRMGRTASARLPARAPVQPCRVVARVTTSKAQTTKGAKPQTGKGTVTKTQPQQEKTQKGVKTVSNRELRQAARKAAQQEAADKPQSNGSRFYLNLTGFPFPLGPTFERKTVRREVGATCSAGSLAHGGNQSLRGCPRRKTLYAGSLDSYALRAPCSCTVHRAAAHSAPCSCSCAQCLCAYALPNQVPLTCPPQRTAQRAATPPRPAASLPHPCPKPPLPPPRDHRTVCTHRPTSPPPQYRYPVWPPPQCPAVRLSTGQTVFHSHSLPLCSCRHNPQGEKGGVRMLQHVLVFPFPHIPHVPVSPYSRFPMSTTSNLCVHPRPEG